MNIPAWISSLQEFELGAWDILAVTLFVCLSKFAVSDCVAVERLQGQGHSFPWQTK